MTGRRSTSCPEDEEDRPREVTVWWQAQAHRCHSSHAAFLSFQPVACAGEAQRIVETRRHKHGRCPEGLSARIGTPNLIGGGFFPSLDSRARGIPLWLLCSSPSRFFPTGPSAPPPAEGLFCAGAFGLAWATVKSSGSRPRSTARASADPDRALRRQPAARAMRPGRGLFDLIIRQTDQSERAKP
jgi:hypothetical protein